MSDTPTYTIEFYEDDKGAEPALAFMRGLTSAKRRAIGVALQEILCYLGPDVAEGNFGRNLGGGLFEFRLDQDAEQVLRRKGKSARPETGEAKILLRMFFHPHGDKLILLLSGYDKAEHTSAQYQNARIEEARTLLNQWRRRQQGT